MSLSIYISIYFFEEGVLVFFFRRVIPMTRKEYYFIWNRSSFTFVYCYVHIQGRSKEEVNYWTQYLEGHENALKTYKYYI